MVDNKFLPKLSQNLLDILDDDEYYDITIEVGKDSYIKNFRAHIVILYYRSPYFQKILSGNKKKDDGTLTNVKLPNVSPESFQILLSYIYGGKLSLEEYDTSDIIEILIAASELNLEELITHLQSFLIVNKSNWMEQNFNLVYQASFENDSLLELQRYCTDFISKEPNKIFNSPNFSSISEKILVSLVQSENLQMKEVQIWEHVLKWGIDQNSGFSSDPTSLSKDDLITLKNTLQQSIPFIRFYNLACREFTDKVLPYKKVLPKELYKDLLKYFLNLSDPDSKQSDKSNPRIIRLKTVDSKIITYQHAELISKWIDKLEINDKLTSQYEFKLLLRGSHDGFTCEKFHEICNNKSRTVTIVKVKDSREILGGYNPVAWKPTNTYGETKDSFIFSFKNNDSIENYILSRVMNEKEAILNNYRAGPSFGGGDLLIFNAFIKATNNCVSSKDSYEKPIRTTTDRFSIEEYEIFQII